MLGPEAAPAALFASSKHLKKVIYCTIIPFLVHCANTVK